MTNCDCGDTVKRVLDMLHAEIEAAGYGDAIKAYSASRYCQEIRDAAQEYFKRGSRGVFITRMNAIIKFGLTDAFNEAAKELGIPLEDLSQDEISTRQEIIDEEKSHVSDLLDYIDGVATDPDRERAYAEVISPRLDMWCARFGSVRSEALTLLGKDAKIEWVYDPEKEHCPSCVKLNGIVKRASFWDTAGVLPRNPPNAKLECKGWQCGCELQVTDKPVRRGKLPRLP